MFVGVGGGDVVGSACARAPLRCGCAEGRAAARRRAATGVVTVRAAARAEEGRAGALRRRELLRLARNAVAAAALSCAVHAEAEAEARTVSAAAGGNAAQGSKVRVGATEVAVFAGGCFWCMEKPFDVIPGVVSTTSGYCGGSEPNPTYKMVSQGKTGHAESVRVEFDPAVVSYEKLLDVYWHNIDPTVRDRQFCDTGKQYRTAIFATTPVQLDAAQKSLNEYRAQRTFGTDRLFTQIVSINPDTAFWPAEDYHQDFYKKNTQLYSFYRFNCGRDQFLERQWSSTPSSTSTSPSPGVSEEERRSAASPFRLQDIPAAIWQRLNRAF